MILSPVELSQESGEVVVEREVMVERGVLVEREGGYQPRGHISC